MFNIKSSQKFLSILFIITVSCLSLKAQAVEPLIYSPVFHCGSGHDQKVAVTGAFEERTGGVMPYTFNRTSETLFEGGPVKPLALSPDGTMLFAVNGPANCLEIYSVTGPDGTVGNADDTLHLISSVLVGSEPVAVAARSNSEVWVVNHISDSVSVVEWDNATYKMPYISNTLLVGDEPRDIVFADSDTCDATNNQNTALITTAYRGQHHPTFQSKHLLIDYDDTNENFAFDAGEKELGRASVFMFDAVEPDVAPKIIPLLAMPARGLAVTPNGCSVYAATFQSGNQTTIIKADNRSKVVIFGDERESTVDGLRASGNADVIVRFDPDSGEWRDGDTETNWGNPGFSLADNDLFKINVPTAWAASSPVASVEYQGLGTHLFNVVADNSNNIFVSNIEAFNDKRYVSDGNLRGHFVEHRITHIADGGTPIVTPIHLNGHLDQAEVATAGAYVTEAHADRSMTQPTEMIIAGGNLYVANFGSHSVTRVPVATLTGTGTDVDSDGDKEIGDSSDPVGRIFNMKLIADQDALDANKGINGGGPSGLVFNDAGSSDRLYVYTRFDNAITIVNPAATTASAQYINRIEMFSPESDVVQHGRPFLYDATLSSINGTGSCGSCHLYGDMDLLAWDLGNLGGATIFNALNKSVLQILSGSAELPSDASSNIQNNLDKVSGPNSELSDVESQRLYPGLVVSAVDNAGTWEGNYGGMGTKLMATVPDANHEDYYLEETVGFDAWDAVNPGEWPDVYISINRSLSQWGGGPGLNTWLALGSTSISSARLDSAAVDAIVPGDYLCAIDGELNPADDECSNGVKPYFVKWINCGTTTWFNTGATPTNPNTAACTPSFVNYNEGDTPSGGVKTTPADWSIATSLIKAKNSPSHREVLLEAWPINAGTVHISMFQGATLLAGGANAAGTPTIDSPFNFHPLKGPMTTQSLRGMADSGALHWRGDKSGGDGVGGGGHCTEVNGVEDCTGTYNDPQELRSFKQFNEAFVGLLGNPLLDPATCLDTGQQSEDKGLCNEDMAIFADFAMRLTYPPNPIRQLDGSLPIDINLGTGNGVISAETGKTLWNGMAGQVGSASTGVLFSVADGPDVNDVDGDGNTTEIATQKFGVNCNSCHTVDSDENLFGTDKTITLELGEQFLKVPHIRNMYQKVGFFHFEAGLDQKGGGTSRAQVSGVGYQHSGKTDTLTNFVDNGLFTEIMPGTGASGIDNLKIRRSSARNLAMFMHAAETNVPSITGQQVTVTRKDICGTEDTNPADGEVDFCDGDAYGDNGEWDGEYADMVNESVGDQLSVVLSQGLSAECDLVASGAEIVLRIKGAAEICAAPLQAVNGAEDTVCFDLQFDGPTYVPMITDGRINEIIVDDPATIGGITYTCLPKRNNDVRMRTDSASFISRTDLTGVDSDTAVFEFSTSSAEEMRRFRFGSVADIDIAFPEQIQIWGSNSSGAVIESTDELLSDMKLDRDLLGTWISDLPIKQSVVPTTAYQYYKVKVLQWYCEGTCSSNSVATSIGGTSWQRVSYVVSPDSDSDGWSDSQEFAAGTNNFLADSDGDGWCDGSGEACDSLAGVDDQFPNDDTQVGDHDNDGEDSLTDLDIDGDGNGSGDCVVVNTDPDVMVAASGSLDCTFAKNDDGSEDGKTASIMTTSTQWDASYASLIWNGGTSGSADDGKVLVVGKGYGGGTRKADFSMTRYNLDGTVDGDFDEDAGDSHHGFLHDVVTDQTNLAYAVTQDSDGNVILAGWSGSWLNARPTITRYSYDGVYESTAAFDTSSLITSDSILYSVIADSSDRVVVAGFVNNGTHKKGLLMRFDSAGVLDTTFGPNNDGVIIETLGAYNDEFYAVTEQAGKYVVAGRLGGDFAIARYNADGTLDGGVGTNDSNTGDTSFGTAGVTTTNTGSTNYSYSMAVQDDGKLVLSGIEGTWSGGTWTNMDIMVARYSADGALDTSFDNDGIQTISVVGLLVNARSVAIQSDGAIVVAGYAGVHSSGSWSDADVLLARLNSDGSLDTTFATDGVQITDINGVSGNDWGYSVLVDEDDKIVVTGKAIGTNGVQEDSLTMRHHP